MQDTIVRESPQGSTEAKPSREDPTSRVASDTSGLQIWDNSLFSKSLEAGNSWIGFASRRVATELALFGNLARARAPNEVLAIWVRFYEQAMHDYADQFGKVMTVMLSAPHSTSLSQHNEQQS